jgi:hypothetical protein
VCKLLDDLFAVGRAQDGQVLDVRRFPEHLLAAVDSSLESSPIWGQLEQVSQSRPKDLHARIKAA